MKKIGTNSKIICTGEANNNDVIVFRKCFEIDSAPQSAPAYISAETKYFLFVNGREVIWEGSLFRNSMPGCSYADEAELAPYLKKGKNCITVFVHYFGNEGRNNKNSGRAGLLFDCGALGLFSDSSWKCIKHPAYYTPGAPSPAYLYGGDNLGFDGNKTLRGVLTADFNDSNFEDASEFDNTSWGSFYLRPVPQIKIEGKQSLKLKKLTPKTSEADKYSAPLPYAMAMAIA